MKYKYSESAGYYGTSGWTCFDSRGVTWNVMANEEDAREYCARNGGVK